MSSFKRKPKTDGTVKEDKDTVEELLQNAISAVENKRKNVEVSREFVRANTSFQEKLRDEVDYRQKRYIIYERNTLHRNATKSKDTYRFRSSFEESRSIALTTSEGYTLGVGGGIGVGYMGTQVGINTGFKFNRSKSFFSDDSTTKTKHQEIEVKVPSRKTVEIKELTYCVPKSCVCKLQFSLKSGDSVPYYYQESEIGIPKHGETKVSRLIGKLESQLKQPRNSSYKCIRRGQTSALTFKSKCQFDVLEHSIETRFLTDEQQQELNHTEVMRRMRSDWTKKQKTQKFNLYSRHSSA